MFLNSLFLSLSLSLFIMKKGKEVWPWVIVGILALAIILLAAFGGFFGSGQVIKSSASSFSSGSPYKLTGVKDVLCEQEYLNSGSIPLWIGDPINKGKQTLTYTDIPGLLDTNHFYGNVDATFTQTISIGRNKITNGIPIFVDMNLDPGSSLYNYYMMFDKAVDFTSPDSIGEWIKIMGQDYMVGVDTNINDLGRAS